ncbi:putative NIF3 family protein [Bifidobacterium actinocoloniiforme DSM 22766]|uniref:GTP cyclohydrolase 1 type 2 homolog n=1 Tax=Bifidobacterium actinocoloniiforme DSM 22766 TaxID=1437605 RepID=A0A086Z047_9BIFI|nr:Nif3-like dinuclear metal center hexameric protein [Bifidobacterium actinocoloniiforme]AKV55160.1 PadR family transcriptional regulator [Bifidobacterium actinocoloniiforme DSM 22766]KFI39897.1 putative NIF3 family protein [Bifidobacterium actinocoloniiforme DSM 22766]
MAEQVRAKAASTVSLGEVVQILERLYPLSYAEDWDHPGLIVGSADWPVSKVFCAVDPTLDVVEEAIASGAQLLICHHPLFFRSVHEVGGFGFRGGIVTRLIESRCGLWVGHTNADAAVRGVAQAAADLMGILDQRPLKEVGLDPNDWSIRDGSTKHESVGLGRVGRLPATMRLEDFARRVAGLLPRTQLGVQVAGEPDARMQTVALLPGSGDSMFDEVRASGVDVYVTSDLRHHPATDAYQQAVYEARLRRREDAGGTARPLLINTPHAAIESLWFTYAAKDIQQAVHEATGACLDLQVIDRSTDPWTFSIQ